MSMNAKERRIWLSQIKRINFEHKQARERELEDQTASFIRKRNQETGVE